MPPRRHALARATPLAVALLAAACAGQEADADAATPEGATSARTAGQGGARPGRWAGVVEGGYKGDSILFTVSPDGREVRDVEFRGHWRCGASPSSRTIKRMDVGHVPGAFAVDADGAFAEAKREPYLLWTLAGHFTAAAAATGSVRIEYDTECDSYKLSWTAAPVG